MSGEQSLLRTGRAHADGLLGSQHLSIDYTMECPLLAIANPPPSGRIPALLQRQLQPSLRSPVYSAYLAEARPVELGSVTWVRWVLAAPTDNHHFQPRASTGLKTRVLRVYAPFGRPVASP